ncbi:MAG: hypothetical protein AAF801_18870, partial [Pseudomonadota bacterium]
MCILRRIGHLIHADDSGILPRQAKPPPPIWHPVLAELTEYLHAHYGDALISIALRGSVARGTDVTGVSDLDLVLFLSGASDRIALQSSLMPDLRIETALVNADTFEVSGSDSWMRFTLALTGWHVWGADIIATLPPPRLGPHAMAHLPRADRWLARWQVYWADETDPAD